MLGSITDSLYGTTRLGTGDVRNGAIGQITALVDGMSQRPVETTFRLNRVILQLQQLEGQLNEELGHQQYQLQCQVTHLQNVWEGRMPELELSPAELPIFESCFQGLKQSINDVNQLLQARKGIRHSFRIFHPSIEAKWIKEIGKLRGWISASEYASLPALPLLTKTIKIVANMLFYHWEARQKVIKLEQENFDVCLRTVELDVNITEKIMNLSEITYAGISGFAKLEEENHPTVLDKKIDRMIKVMKEVKECFIESIRMLSLSNPIKEQQIAIGELETMIRDQNLQLFEVLSEVVNLFSNISIVDKKDERHFEKMNKTCALLRRLIEINHESAIAISFCREEGNVKAQKRTSSHERLGTLCANSIESYHRHLLEVIGLAKHEEFLEFIKNIHEEIGFSMESILEVMNELVRGTMHVPTDFEADLKTLEISMSLPTIFGQVLSQVQFKDKTGLMSQILVEIASTIKDSLSSTPSPVTHAPDISFPSSTSDPNPPPSN